MTRRGPGIGPKARGMARALVKTPSPNFASGLTSQSEGFPDLALALAQHRAYQQALEKMGLEVLLLPPDQLPDSCFVEDMAVVAEPLVLYRVGAGAYGRRGGLAMLRSDSAA